MPSEPENEVEKELEQERQYIGEAGKALPRLSCLSRLPIEVRREFE